MGLSVLGSALCVAACSPQVHAVEYGLYQPRSPLFGERVTFELDGRFTYVHASYGPTQGNWHIEDGELVLSAPSSLQVEAFGKVSPLAETVPVQVLGVDGRPTGDSVRFLHEGKEEDRIQLVDGVARVSRYLPFEAVQILPFAARCGHEWGPTVEDEVFHSPYAAYRITVALGRRFDEERWIVKKKRLIQPATEDRARRVFRWQEPEREILE